MILKICRRKFINNDKKGSIETVTEFYNGNSFKEANGNVIIDDKETVIITDYEQSEGLTENFIKYETVYAFIMNNEGKTIERLI